MDATASRQTSRVFELSRAMFPLCTRMPVAHSRVSWPLTRSLKYPPGFRPRRGLNWVFIGLLYTSFYMCRYNFRSRRRGIGRGVRLQQGRRSPECISALRRSPTRCGQIINGLLTDRIGGKTRDAHRRRRHDHDEPALRLRFLLAALARLFVAIRRHQRLHAVVRRARHGQNERRLVPAHRARQFAGIFGFMINWADSGSTISARLFWPGLYFLGLWRIPPLALALALSDSGRHRARRRDLLAIFVKDTPEEAGFPAVNPEEEAGGAGPRRVWRVVHHHLHQSGHLDLSPAPTPAPARCGRASISGSPFSCSEAASCRLSIRAVSIGRRSSIPLVAVARLVHLRLSFPTRFFNGHRSPVACRLYFLETRRHSRCGRAVPLRSNAGGCLFLVLISLTANSTHSIVGTAAPMDIGGAKDGGLRFRRDRFLSILWRQPGRIRPWRIARSSWGSYFYFMAPFGIRSWPASGAIGGFADADGDAQNSDACTRPVMLEPSLARTSSSCSCEPAKRRGRKFRALPDSRRAGSRLRTSIAICSAKIPSPVMRASPAANHSTVRRRANAGCARAPFLFDRGNVRRASARRAARSPTAIARPCNRQIAHPLSRRPPESPALRDPLSPGMIGATITPTGIPAARSCAIASSRAVGDEVRGSRTRCRFGSSDVTEMFTAAA